jgi:hypothetical protein
MIDPAIGTEIVKQTAAGIGRLAGPLADEIGGWAAERFQIWRRRNIEAVLAKAVATVEAAKLNSEWHASPRVIANVLENAGWTDDKQLQDFWANLLATAVSPNGESEESLLYVPILVNLTTGQAKILDDLLSKRLTMAQYPGDQQPFGAKHSIPEWLDLTGARDIEELMATVQSLANQGLISDDNLNEFFAPDDPEPELHATRFGMRFYARVNGYSGPMDKVYVW